MKKIPKMMNQAASLQKQGKIPEAARLLDDILKSSSSFVPALNMRGLLHLQGKQYQTALKMFKRVMEIEPKNVAAHENLGRTYMLMGQFEHAERHFRRALDLKPDAVNSAMGLGNTCMAQGKYKDTLSILQGLKAAKHGGASLTLNIGLANEKLGRYEEAILSFKEAISLAPNSPNGDLCLGKLFASRKEHAMAEHHFSRAMTLGASDPETELCLAQAQLKQGKEDLAGKHFFEVTRRAPEFQGGYIELDNFLLFSGSPTKKKLIESLSGDHVYRDWEEPLVIASRLGSMYDYPDADILETLGDFWSIYRPGELNDRAWWTRQLSSFGPQPKGHDKVLRGIHSAVFSWSLPDSETLATVAEFTRGTRLRSYGAGSALWERLLQDHFDIPVMATDYNLRHRFLEVQIEDFSDAEINESDTIFLAWIISGNTSVLNILKKMRVNQRLVFIGEPPSRRRQSGICASPAVFAYLREYFTLEKTLPLVNYSHLNDTCSFYRKH